MEIGCHLPVYGGAATREGVLQVADRIEALGYDSLWVSDHVVIPWEIRSRYPYNATGDFPLVPGTDFLEPLTALTLAAAVTTRVRLGTSVLVLPHRHPVLTAKMLATLDHLAPGRVILGAGVGWMREEIELFGVPYGRRGAWTDKAIKVMRACWRDDRVSFKGEFFNFADLGCRPAPPAAPSPSGSAATPPAPSPASRRSATAGTPPSPRRRPSAKASPASARRATRPTAIPPR